MSPIRHPHKVRIRCLFATHKLSRARSRLAPKFYGSYGNAQRLRSSMKAASDCSLGAGRKGRTRIHPSYPGMLAYSMFRPGRYNTPFTPSYAPTRAFINSPTYVCTCELFFFSYTIVDASIYVSVSRDTGINHLLGWRGKKKCLVFRIFSRDIRMKFDGDAPICHIEQFNFLYRSLLF